jgi:hypothetical protein
MVGFPRRNTLVWGRGCRPFRRAGYLTLSSRPRMCITRLLKVNFGCWHTISKRNGCRFATKQSADVPPKDCYPTIYAICICLASCHKGRSGAPDPVLWGGVASLV